MSKLHCYYLNHHYKSLILIWLVCHVKYCYIRGARSTRVQIRPLHLWIERDSICLKFNFVLFLLKFFISSVAHQFFTFGSFGLAFVKWSIIEAMNLSKVALSIVIKYWSRSSAYSCRLPGSSQLLTPESGQSTSQKLAAVSSASSDRLLCRRRFGTFARG